MPVVVDADAHVVETERTWEYMDEEAVRFRPKLVAPQDEPRNLRWMVEDKLRRRAMLGPQRGPQGRNTEAPEEAREMVDVERRLSHMDQLGIDVQVLHNTIFIETVADRPEVEIAVCKSWNRWLADLWKQGKGRLRWSCVVPIQTMDVALSEIRTAKENGAVAVCLRPIEGNRTLVDPYFYPIYEEASRLDLAIAVHIANGNAAYCDVFRSPYDPGAAFGMFRAPTAIACHSYIMSEVPHRFPILRWGFIEASAQWVPWVIHEARRRYEAAGKAFPDDVLKEYRAYVTCQTDDDLPYILNYAGEDSLVIGTDYGHFDPSSEVDAISVLKKRSDIDPSALGKILSDNPRALYQV